MSHILSLIEIKNRAVTKISEAQKRTMQIFPERTHRQSSLLKLLSINIARRINTKKTIGKEKSIPIVLAFL